MLDEILGPDFHGPSSSHTAAPQLMALKARELLGGTPDRINVELVNTYATSSEGHGTKGAILAGLLGLALTIPKTPNAEEIAERQGLHPLWEPRLDEREKDNTLIFRLQRGAIRLHLRAVSTGGGNYTWLNIHLDTRALTSSEGDDHERCQ
jgi:L-serine dehydratase